MVLRDASERFGSADFSSTKDLKKAGLLNQKNGSHLGFTREKKPSPIYRPNENSSITFGISGSRKSTSNIGFKLFENDTNLVVADFKPELAEISALNIGVNKYFLNGYGAGAGAPWFLPTDHRMNPLDFTDPSKPSFFEDMTMMAMAAVKKPIGGGSGNAEHFYGKAMQVTTSVLIDGKACNPHFSLVDLYNVINDIQSGSGEYFDFHINRMKNSVYSSVRAVALELESKATMVPPEFGSIMSTISNSLQFFGSPTMQSMVSSPSTISPKEFVNGEAVNHLYIRFPEHVADQSATAIRCIMTALFIEQQRNPVRPLKYLLDKSSVLGNFSLIPKICFLGRGCQTTADIYVQNYGQLLHNFGENETDTILSNCPFKLILGVSSDKTGKFVSDLLGKTTYRYLPQSKRAEASFKRAQAIQQVINGGDLNTAMLDIMRQSKTMKIPDSVARQLMNADEIIRRSADEGLLIGTSLKPYRTFQQHYFLDRNVAHKFLPNPFHPPFDKIFIPTRFGRMKAIKIISEKVPASISQLPQYSSGYWSYPENFNPLQQKRFGIFNR